MQVNADDSMLLQRVGRMSRSLKCLKETLESDSALFWLVFWLLWSAWLSFIYWGLGPHSYLRVHDNGDANLLCRMLAARDLLDHGLTFWRPQLSGGMDALTAGGLGSFLIDVVPFVMFSPWLAYGLIMWVQRFCASYFTYRLCRDFLGLDNLPSIYAGIAYSLFEWSVYDWMLSYGLGLPAVAFYLWAFERCLAARGVRRFVLIGMLGLFASFAMSFAMTTPFFWGAMLVWFVVVRGYRSGSFFLGYAVFVVSSVVGAVPGVWALWLNAPLSGRATSNPYDTGLAAFLLGTIGDLLQQKVSYILVLLGLWACKLKDKLALKLLLVSVLFGPGNRLITLFSPYFRPYLGFLAGFSFNRFGQFHLLFAPIVGACGLHLLSKHWADRVLAVGVGRISSIKYKTMKPSLAVGVVAIGIAVYASMTITGELLGRLPSDSYSVNYQNPDLRELAASESSDLLRVATVGTRMATYKAESGLDIHPAYAQAYGFETVDGYYSLYSQRYQDYWTRVVEKVIESDKRLQRNSEYYLRHWVYLYAPLSGAFNQREVIEFSDYYNITLLSLANTKYLISRWQLIDPNLKLVSAPIRALEQRREWDRRSRLEKLFSYLKGEYPPRPLYIYENASVLPRAFLVPQVRIFDTPDALLDTLKDTPVAEIRRTAFLESANASTVWEQSLGFTRNEVEILDYTPDRIVVSVHADGPGILVITNNYSPFWKVRVDGIQQTIVPAYHTFQGVYLEAGQHEVVFEYDPPYKLFWDAGRR